MFLSVFRLEPVSLLSSVSGSPELSDALVPRHIPQSRELHPIKAITNAEYGQGGPHFLDLALNVVLLQSDIMFSSLVAVKHDQSLPVVYFR